MEQKQFRSKYYRQNNYGTPQGGILALLSLLFLLHTYHLTYAITHITILFISLITYNINLEYDINTTLANAITNLNYCKSQFKD